MLILLDSRCPPLHYPPSLHEYLSTFREPRKVIFVLTKVDICGAERSSLWQEYLHKLYPEHRIVKVESYQEKEVRGGQGKRKFFEPHMPGELRRSLVDALKSAHEELCSPPPSVAARPERLAAWRPTIFQSIDWDAVVKAGGDDISSRRPDDDIQALPKDDNADNSGEDIPEYISVGLIGMFSTVVA